MSFVAMSKVRMAEETVTAGLHETYFLSDCGPSLRISLVDSRNDRRSSISRNVAAAATCVEGHQVAYSGEAKNRQRYGLDTVPG